MAYNPKKHHRRSIRLKGYDYAQAGLYFITLCAYQQKHLFGRVINGKMYLNPLGLIAQQEWINTLNIRTNVKLGASIVMPNHFHAIIHIETAAVQTENIGAFRSPSHTIGAIIRGYKGATTKKIKELIRGQLDAGESSSSTGELLFAPANKTLLDRTDTDDNPSTGELLFAPTTYGYTANIGIPLSSIDLSRSIWQRDYYDHIIRDERAYQNISNYIINNPQKWAKDKFFKS